MGLGVAFLKITLNSEWHVYTTFRSSVRRLDRAIRL